MSKSKIIIGATLLVWLYALSIPYSVRPEGLLDFADPCKKAEKSFKTTTTAVESRVKEVVESTQAWRNDPSKMPPHVLTQYRAIVKAAAYKAWEESPGGKGTIKSWKDENPNVDVPTKFAKYIYDAQMTQDDEIKWAHLLFQRHYDESLKAQIDSEVATVNRTLSEKKKELDGQCSPDVFNQVFRSTIGRAVMIVNSNFEAAKNEKGDIAGALRAITGISLTDIFKHGLGGGENSELNKLRVAFTDGLDKIGVGENHFLRQTFRALDITQIDTPKSVQINIDDGTAGNICKNLTLGICR